MSFTEKIFVYRIETYNQSTKPIVEHYQKLDKVRNIAADGSPEEVAVIIVSFHWLFYSYIFFYKFEILTAVTVEKVSMHHCTDFCSSQLNCCRDRVIFQNGSRPPYSILKILNFVG